MTYREYIDKLNRLYAKRHQKLLILAELAKEGVGPIIEVGYDNDGVEQVNIAEQVEQIDKEIYAIVQEASEEPWFNMHSARLDQTLEILTYGVPAGIRAEKPKKDFRDFTF